MCVYVYIYIYVFMQIKLHIVIYIYIYIYMKFSWNFLLLLSLSLSLSYLFIVFISLCHCQRTISVRRQIKRSQSQVLILKPQSLGRKLVTSNSAKGNPVLWSPKRMVSCSATNKAVPWESSTSILESDFLEGSVKSNKVLFFIVLQMYLREFWIILSSTCLNYIYIYI